jgi:CO/xanthine dehydrogenase Mo-binding subunit
MSSPAVISASTPRDRATGRARYAADLVPEGAVVAGMARSPHPHARVTRIDPRRALDVPGVLGVLTPADFAGIRLGHLRADEPVLADVARYVGDGVAAVAAADAKSLARGIEALDIDYEILPHALTVDDAAALATPIHESCHDNVATRFTAERGDWDAAASRVAAWAEGTFDTEAVPHAYLEPRACFVRYAPDRLELVAGSHAPSLLAENYQRIVEGWGTGLDVVTPDIGGSFGAKWGHPTHLICLAFAHRLERNVAMVFSRREDMIAGRTRVAMRIHLRVGATANGELVAKQTTVVADNGAYSLHGPAVMTAAAIRADNLYRFSAVKADARLVYTNNMPSECFRGFGMPQAAFALEQLIDELARRLDRDPVEFRRSNAIRPEDTTIHGWRIGSCGFEDCLDAVSARIAEHRKTFAPPANGRHRIGYGIAGVIHCISNRGYDARFDGANVVLAVDPDGTIRILSAEVELGCGTVEVLTAMVARELDVARGRLRVVLGNTASGPYGLGSFASRTAFFIGRAALDACQRFKDACRRLGPDLGLSANAPIADVVDAAARAGRGADLKTAGVFEPVDVDIPDDSGYGNISPAYTFGVQGCCVRIDTLTGKISVEQFWAAHDAGTILNRNGAMGQVIGGVVQGLGLALYEALAVDADGQVLNPGFLDTRVATFPDAVPVDVVFVPTFEETGPDGGKTIAELPLIPVAACVANAVYDALGVRQYRLPMTAERVWRTLQPQPAAAACSSPIEN